MCGPLPGKHGELESKSKGVLKPRRFRKLVLGDLEDICVLPSTSSSLH